MWAGALKDKSSLAHVGREHLFGKTSTCFKSQTLDSNLFAEWAVLLLEARPGL